MGGISTCAADGQSDCDREREREQDKEPCTQLYDVATVQNTKLVIFFYCVQKNPIIMKQDKYSIYSSLYTVCAGSGLASLDAFHSSFH